MEFITEWLDTNDIYHTANLLHYWDGFVVTVQLVFLALLLGLIVALPLAILRYSRIPVLNQIVYGYTYFFRGTPLLIQLYMIYYGVTLIDGIQESVFWPLVKEPFYPALLAFVLNTAAYTTEILRGSMVATPHGEIEAAKAYGMTWAGTMRRIIIPSAFRRSLPAYSNEVIFMLHASAIASTVTIVDLTGAARDVYSRHYAPFEAFLLAAAIYLCVTFTIVYSFRVAERHLLGHLQPR